MSETTTAEASPAAEVETTDTTETETHKPPREQRYRLERNSAREERDALHAKLETLQTAELHRLAGEHLAAAEDIELSGKSLADYLTPEGWLDHEAVADAAADLIESRPGLAKHQTVRAVDRSQASGGADKAPLEWSDLFKN